MEVALINPFLTATMDVLQTMAQVPATPGKPYLKNNQQARGDVTGVIGIMGHAKGTISVTFTESAILPIVSGMLGETFTSLNRDVGDAVGEITNMISGQARRMLAENGMQFDGAIPSVIMGKNHTIYHIAAKPVLAIPFTTPHGKLTVEVCIA